MAKGIRKFPVKDPRAIFICAEDFKKAVQAIGWTTTLGRTVGPKTVCTVLATELYLKCLLADCFGEFPGVHDLRFLFEALPKKERNAILMAWREERKEWLKYPPHKPISGLRRALTTHSKSFENWRYRFQSTRKQLPERKVLHSVNRVLYEFLLSRHPDWRSNVEEYFWATFPAP